MKKNLKRLLGGLLITLGVYAISFAFIISLNFIEGKLGITIVASIFGVGTVLFFSWLCGKIWG